MQSRRLPPGIFLLVLAISPNLSGQDTASLNGTVTDPTGAVITDTQVIVTNSDNGVGLRSRTLPANI